jgi:hypothetical protein
VGEIKMALPDLTEPRVSEDIAQFFGDGAASPVSKLNYNVPLPGGYSFNRIVPLELDPAWFGQASRNLGASLLELGVVEGDENALANVNPDLLTRIYQSGLSAEHRPSRRAVSRVNGDVLPLLSDAMRAAGAEPAPRIRARAINGEDFSVLDRRIVAAEPDDVEIQRRRTNSYITQLTAQQTAGAPFFQRLPFVRMPVPGIGSSIYEININPVAPATPRFGLVETWELRSFLGDYGLGRTLNTFYLLPGERTTITVETWRTNAATREDSTSIFDSSDLSAQTRFTDAIMGETGAARQDQGGWALSVNTGASGGVNVWVVDFNANVDVAFAANHQEATQQWSKNIRQATSEHTNQVNNSRRQSVTSTSTTATTTGAATTTVREISNTNLRRVLNFVYRELNQTYRTYVVLRDIKVAFYNGKVGSAEIVPLGEIGPLIARHIVPPQQEEVARLVLSVCAERLDIGGNPTPVLQVGSLQNGTRYGWENAELGGDGRIVFNGNPIGAGVRWRFAPGPLSGENPEVQHTINGLITDVSEVVLRTDSVVAEALLGEADALDPYAAALQALDLESRQADVDWRKADTRRITEALELVQNARAADRVDIWTRIFPDNPEIQVVPVAAVTEGDGA